MRLAVWVVVVAVVVSVWAAAPVGAQDGGYEDVDAASTHGAAIHALADDGVFEGTECGPDRFCPADGVERWVMAVWLVRVLDGSDPEAQASRFSDIESGQWWEAHVERLAELGVTHGCGEGRFCPHREVTRAQMASFLVRAFGLAAGPDAGFEDVASGSTHEANINALAASEVTLGCSEGRFCPGRATTRAQMATFLTRALATQTPDPDPAGQFQALSAGWSHTCGLGTDGTITCWGYNRRFVSQAPAGQFREVTAGFIHSCALGVDDTIVCWGRWDMTRDAPRSGRFQSVSAGAGHTCALGDDDAVVCWGGNDDGQSDAPSGDFLTASAGFDHSCGLRAGGTIACWGRQRGRAVRRACRAVPSRQRRRALFVRVARRRHSGVLGLRRRGPDCCSFGTVRVCFCRHLPCVRTGRRRCRRLLGQQRVRPDRSAPRTVPGGDRRREAFVRADRWGRGVLLGRQRSRPDVRTFVAAD